MQRSSTYTHGSAPPLLRYSSGLVFSAFLGIDFAWVVQAGRLAALKAKSLPVPSSMAGSTDCPLWSSAALAERACKRGRCLSCRWLRCADIATGITEQKICRFRSTYNSQVCRHVFLETQKNLRGGASQEVQTIHGRIYVRIYVLTIARE